MAKTETDLLLAPYKPADGSMFCEWYGEKVAGMLQAEARKIVAIRAGYKRNVWRNTHPLEHQTVEGQFFKMLRLTNTLQCGQVLRGGFMAPDLTGLIYSDSAYQAARQAFVDFRKDEFIAEKRALLHAIDFRTTETSAP